MVTKAVTNVEEMVTMKVREMVSCMFELFGSWQAAFSAVEHIKNARVLLPIFLSKDCNFIMQCVIVDKYFLDVLVITRIFQYGCQFNARLSNFRFYPKNCLRSTTFVVNPAKSIHIRQTSCFATCRY